MTSPLSFPARPCGCFRDDHGVAHWCHLHVKEADGSPKQQGGFPPPPRNRMSIELGNEVCSTCYKWVKGTGPEPYSPAVAELTVKVLNLCERAYAEGKAEPVWHPATHHSGAIAQACGDESCALPGHYGEDPYCDVCGRDGKSLTSPVEVCRDCLSVAESDLHAVRHELREAEVRISQLKVRIAELEGAPAAIVPAAEVPSPVGTYDPSAPFPETIVYGKLDGSMRKYIPTDGVELNGLLEGAKREGTLEALAAHDRCWNKNHEETRDAITSLLKKESEA